MPVDMSKYPDNWQEIRERILRRAGGSDDDPRVGACCEWCNIQNYTVCYRDILGDPVYSIANMHDDYKAACVDRAEMRKETGEHYIVIVLTIAHLDDPDPHNCADDNLAALCQKCHNDYDMEMRQKNAAATRRQNLIDDGQMVLPLGGNK